MKLTEKQKSLLEMYAKKAHLSTKEVINWVETGAVTISEISLGILGVPHIEKREKNFNHFNWMQ